jgi:hypothetical protein
VVPTRAASIQARARTDQIVVDDPLCAQILAQPSEVEILLGCPTVVQ